MNTSDQLKVFIGGTSRQRVKGFMAASHADSTRRAYEAGLQHFKRWGGKIPSTPLQVARYAAYQAGKWAYASIQQRMAAIHRAHLTRDLKSPVRTELVRATMKGIARTYSTKQRQMKPVLKHDLPAMVRHMKGFRGCRDRALILLGFFGGFRSSELVAVTVEDLQWVRGGLVVTVRRSKTDQEGEGREVNIPAMGGPLCAVRAIRIWLKSAAIDSGAVFRPVNRYGRATTKRLSAEGVGIVVRRYVEAIGLNPTEYCSHSLRAGLVTSAALSGAAAWQIRKQTGHKSDAVLARYIRDDRRFQGNVAKRIFKAKPSSRSNFR